MTTVPGVTDDLYTTLALPPPQPPPPPPPRPPTGVTGGELSSLRSSGDLLLHLTGAGDPEELAEVDLLTGGCACAPLFAALLFFTTCSAAFCC